MSLRRQNFLLIFRSLFFLSVVLSVSAQPVEETESTRSSVYLSYLNEIESLLQDQVYNEATRRLESWLRENPEDAYARRLICRAYAETEDAFRLRFHARLLNELYPEDPQVQKWLTAANEVIENEYPARVEELEAALANDPDNRNIRRDLINLYLLGERKDDAIREFKVLLAEDPEDKGLLLEYARNLAWMDRLEKSIAAYNRYAELVDELTIAVRLELARVHAWNSQYRQSVSMLNEIVAEEPENLDARVLLGDIYRWTDDSVAATSLYTYVLDRDEDHPEALAGMRALEESERKRNEATGALSIPDMQVRVDENPEDAQAVRQLARLYAAKNDYGSAIEYYEKYLELRPDNVPVLRDYAFCLSMEEKYEEAIEQLRRYLEDFPEDVSVRLNIVNMLMWSERYDEAEEELLSMIDQASLYPEIIWKLARVHHMQGDYEDAIAYYSELKESAPEYSVAQAKIREIEKQPGYKLTKLEERVAENPNDLESRLSLAMIYLEAERYWEAREQAKDVLRIDPSNLEAERIVSWADIGLQEYRYERLREMRARLRKDPSDTEAILEIARLLKEEENYEDAIRFFHSYLSLVPEDDEVLEEYIMTMYWIPGYQGIAAEELVRLLDFQPGNIELHLLYLELMQATNQLQDQDYETMRAIEEELNSRLLLDPGNPQYYYWFGRLSQILGDYEQALELYYYAADRLPDDAELLVTVQERIESLENSVDYQIKQLAGHIDQNPNNVSRLLDLAILQYDSERYYDARETSKRVLEIDPGNREALNIINASERFVLREKSEKMRRLRYEVTHYPYNTDAQLELARLLSQEGHYDEARARYRMYLSAYPSDFEVRREYAEMLSWTELYRNEAIQELRQLAEVYPYDYDFQLLVVRVMTWDKRYWEEAEERLAYLSRLMGDDPEILILQGDLARYQGRFNQAQKRYDRVIEMTGHTPGYYSRHYMKEKPRSGTLRETRKYDTRGRQAETVSSQERTTKANYSRSSEVKDRDLIKAIEIGGSNRRVVEEQVRVNYLRNYLGTPEKNYEDVYFPTEYGREQFRKFLAERRRAAYESGVSSRNAEQSSEEEKASSRIHRSHKINRRPVQGPLYYRDPDLYPTGDDQYSQQDEFSSADSRQVVIEHSEEHSSLHSKQTSDGASFRSPSVERVEGQADPLRPHATQGDSDQPARRPLKVSEINSFRNERSEIPEVRRYDLNQGYSSRSFRRRELEDPAHSADSDLPEEVEESTNSDESVEQEQSLPEEEPVSAVSRAWREREAGDRSQQDLPNDADSRERTEERVQTRRPYPPRLNLPIPAESRRYPNRMRYPEPGYAQPDDRHLSYRYRSMDNPYRPDYRYRSMDDPYRPEYPVSRLSPYYGRERALPYGTERMRPEFRGQFVDPYRYGGRSVPPYGARYYERAPVRDPYDDLVNPRYRYRFDPDPGFNEQENYVPPVGRRLYNQKDRLEYLEDSYRTYRDEVPYDRDEVPYDRDEVPYDRDEVPYDRDADYPKPDTRAPVSGRPDRIDLPEERQPVLDEFARQQRFYGPSEFRRAEESRRMIAEPPTVEEISQPERVQVQPAVTMFGYRQLGDTSVPQSRISPLGDRIAVGEVNTGFASRAEAGLLSIDEQLSPRVALFFGVESDTDDFSGYRVGGRYSHFLDNGTKLDLGITYYEYNEDSGLSLNDEVDATMYTLGVSAPLGDRLTGSAEINFTDFSIDPDFTVGGGIGASFAVDMVNTLALDYEYYDAIHSVKTIRSLEQDITVDRARISWSSNPLANRIYREFWQRIYFEGNLSYAAYSDSNRGVSFLLRPYFRVLDEPSLDFVVGYRGLYYDFSSPYYWSPDSYSGPLFGFRIKDQTFWDFIYEIRAEIFFPSSTQVSRSISFDLRKNFTQDLSIGGNLFMIESPREDEDLYRYYGLFFDLVYRF